MSKIQGTLAQWRDRLRRKELSPAELVNLTADALRRTGQPTPTSPLTVKQPSTPRPERIFPAPWPASPSP